MINIEETKKDILKELEEEANSVTRSNIKRIIKGIAEEQSSIREHLNKIEFYKKELLGLEATQVSVTLKDLG